MFSGEKKAPAAAAEGRKKLGSGTRTGFWIPETGFWIPGPVFWIPGPVFWIPGLVFRIPGPVLDPR